MTMKSLSDILNLPQQKRKYNSAKKTKHQQGIDFLFLIKNWHKVVGPRLAKNTIPLKLQQKKLTILTDHSIVSQQLSYMRKELINNITQEYPKMGKSIEDFSFIVNPTFFKKKKDSLKTVLGEKPSTPSAHHPYSPEYRRLKKEAEELFKDIEDENIKELFHSLFIQGR